MSEVRKKLRKLLKERPYLIAPCGYDVLSAKAIEASGFEIMGTTGYGMHGVMLGTPDTGLLALNETVTTLSNMCDAVRIPVLADCEGGFGNALNVCRAVKAYEKAGVAGLFIEDQKQPPNCPFIKPAEVISQDEMIGKIHAALDARTDEDMLIIARTDAAKSLGFDEALRRARLYYEAGADMIFITVPPRAEDMQRIADLPFPVCTSIVEGTVNEDFTVDQLAEMGFKLVKFPQTLIRASMRAMHDVLESLRRTGGTKEYRDRIATQKERGIYSHISDFSDFQAKIENKNSFKVDE